MLCSGRAASGTQRPTASTRSRCGGDTSTDRAHRDGAWLPPVPTPTSSTRVTSRDGRGRWMTRTGTTRVRRPPSSATLCTAPTSTPTVPTPTPTPAPPLVLINKIRFDPPGDQLDREFVSIKNLGTSSADLTGWTLREQQGNVYTFPAFTLAGRRAVEDLLRLRNRYDESLVLDAPSARRVIPAPCRWLWQASERLPTWTQRPRTWVFECKLCRARFTYRSYCWPCCAKTPPHDTFHEVTARRIYCIGSRCLGACWGAWNADSEPRELRNTSRTSGP